MYLPQSNSGTQTEVILGDCLSVLKQQQDNSIDLIVTSPPYGDQRAKTYGGIKQNEKPES